ncbi:hypothetical protein CAUPRSCDRAFT_10933 [Caulochytrium protostelioides]|uniref:Uncharacterized protein n=1 Tax=Caulochytrium protostelioides TaxID=1555241 RepID=A0A4P9WY00_9FUNG|nr:hypothetical protein CAUPRSCDRAFT_10933 [Caulochytrium protostelioides]
MAGAGVATWREKPPVGVGRRHGPECRRPRRPSLRHTAAAAPEFAPAAAAAGDAALHPAPRSPLTRPRGAPAAAAAPGVASPTAPAAPPADNVVADGIVADIVPESPYAAMLRRRNVPGAGAQAGAQAGTGTSD